MLGSDGSVIKSGRDGVGERDLPCLILQHVGVGALQNARGSTVEARCVAAQLGTPAARLDTDQADTRLIDKVVKRAHRVGPSPYACKHSIRQTGFLFQDLLFDLLSDHAMKI